MDRVNAYKLSDYTKNGKNPELKKEAEEQTGNSEGGTSEGDNSAA